MPFRKVRPALTIYPGPTLVPAVAVVPPRPVDRSPESAVRLKPVLGPVQLVFYSVGIIICADFT